jgi:hypothetical protein
LKDALDERTRRFSASADASALEGISAGPPLPDGRHGRNRFVAPPHRISSLIRLVVVSCICGCGASPGSVGPTETVSCVQVFDVETIP